MKKGVGHPGFTLIELLVVIAIIALLSSVILAALNSARSSGMDAQRVANGKELQKALELYYNKNGVYPSTCSPAAASCSVTAAALIQSSTADWIPGLRAAGFIGELPDDPQQSSVCRNMYRSNGTDYKLWMGYGGQSSTGPAVTGCTGAEYGGGTSLMDPRRDNGTANAPSGGTNTCVVDGSLQLSYTFYTKGACTY